MLRNILVVVLYIADIYVMDLKVKIKNITFR